MMVRNVSTCKCIQIGYLSVQEGESNRTTHCDCGKEKRKRPELKTSNSRLGDLPSWMISCSKVPSWKRDIVSQERIEETGRRLKKREKEWSGRSQERSLLFPDELDKQLQQKKEGRKGLLLYQKKSLLRWTKMRMMIMTD